MTLLSLESVNKRFVVGNHEMPVLENVSLDVEEGDFIGIHGERRSGKSILLRIAAGWERPDEGRVVFADRDIWSLSDRGRAKWRRGGGIGLASGTWRPSSNKPVLRHLQEALICEQMSVREAAAPALHTLDLVDLAHAAYAPSNRLSQGELIKFALAMRLIHKPRILLIDEPAVLLRPSEAVELYDLLARLGRAQERAVLIASEEITPIRMARRRFSLDDCTLHSMDRPAGEVLEFPGAKRTARRA